MKIIDAQIHLWTKEHAVVVPPHRTEPFGIEEALREMDAAGVHGAIVHPPHWDPNSHALAIEAATRCPDRFAILGRIEPDDPDRLERLSTWTPSPGGAACGNVCEPHEKTGSTTAPSMALARGRESAFGSAARGRILPQLPGWRNATRVEAILDHFGVRKRQSRRRGRSEPAGSAGARRAPNSRSRPPAARVRVGPSLREPQDRFTRFRRVRPGRMFWARITRMPCSWRECVLPSPTTSHGCPAWTCRGSWGAMRMDGWGTDDWS